MVIDRVIYPCQSRIMSEILPPQTPESQPSPNKDSVFKKAVGIATGVSLLAGGGALLGAEGGKAFDHNQATQEQENKQYQQQAELSKFQNGGAQEEYDKFYSENKINYYTPPTQTEATNPAGIPGSTETKPISVDQLPVDPATGEHELPAPDTH